MKHSVSQLVSWPVSRLTGKPEHQKTDKLKSGQAMVMVLLVAVILISVTTLSVAMIVTNNLSGSTEERGQHALEIAESGAEEGLLRVLRDPSTVTTSPISLTVDEGYATVDISGSSPKTITSRGVLDGYVRQIQVTAQYSAGKLTISSWKEN